MQARFAFITAVLLNIHIFQYVTMHFGQVLVSGSEDCIALERPDIYFKIVELS